jgi:hypothetical protein
VSERGQLAEAIASVTTLVRKSEEVTSQFVADHMQKLAEGKRRGRPSAAGGGESSAKNERVKLRAPIAGTAATTIGQVVTTGQPLLTIAPLDSPIEIEVMIQNKDICFVEPGQPAVVKVESFRSHAMVPSRRRAQGLARRCGRARGYCAQRSRCCGQAVGRDYRDRAGKAAEPCLSGQHRAQVPGHQCRWQGHRPVAGHGRCRRDRTGQRRAIDYVLSPLCTSPGIADGIHLGAGSMTRSCASLC